MHVRYTLRTRAGSFEIITLRELETYKDAGQISVSKSGLDTWVPGFDAATAAEAAKKKAKGGGFLGIF